MVTTVLGVLSISSMFLFWWGGTALAALVLLAAGRHLQQEMLHSKRTNGMPGTRGWPVINETIPFAVSPRKFFQDGFERYGPYFRTRLMGKDLVIISGNTACTLAYCNEEAFGVRLFDPLMKLLDGFMLIQNGKEHKKNRGLIVRALSDAQLRMNVKGIAQAFHTELKHWSSKNKVEIFSSVKRAILIVMLSVLFGNSSLSQSEIDELVIEFECYGKGFLAMPINLPFTTLGRAYVARDRIIKKLVSIVEQRREECRKDPGVERKDLLQTMIDSADPETGDRADTSSIANNSLVMLLAALDTTASVVASMIKILGQYPDVLTRVREECCQVWGTKIPISEQPAEEIASKLTNLPFLDCVIQETMRVRAPLMGTFRYAKMDVKIPGTDFIIPEGWMVGVAHDYSFTSDSQAFPEPEKFFPERFLPNGTSSSCANFKAQHFPFSKGIHMCPGGRFAVAETKIIVSLLALHEEWPKQIGTCSTLLKQNPALEEYGGVSYRFFAH